MTQPKFLYAIGDIHGCYGKLIALLDKIELHADGAPYLCAFLGDYVDRGPHSRDVVALVKRLCTDRTTKDRYTAIRGNHEQLMIEACADPNGDAMTLWYESGGDATIESYQTAEDDLEYHAEWLGSLQLFHETERYFFVHAGVNRRHPLHEQTEEVMLWTRNWERHEHDFGKHIVYGHNPADEPRLMKYSTGLDTGAVYGGPLSAGVFDASVAAGPVRVLQAE